MCPTFQSDFKQEEVPVVLPQLPVQLDDASNGHSVICASDSESINSEPHIGNHSDDSHIVHSRTPSPGQDDNYDNDSHIIQSRTPSSGQDDNDDNHFRASPQRAQTLALVVYKFYESG